MFQWLVFVHLGGLILFVGAHGVSMAIAFEIRGLRDPEAVARQLGLSQRTMGIAYLGLILLAAGGLGAAWVARLLATPWVVASAVVLVMVSGAMYAVGTAYYVTLRRAVAADTTGRPAISPDALEALLASRRPEVLAAVGGLGLAILTWLMVLKPG